MVTASKLFRPIDDDRACELALDAAAAEGIQVRKIIDKIKL